MGTNTDKLGREETNTARIPRPALKPVPKITTPAVPTSNSDTTEIPVSPANPLKGVPRKRSTDTVHLKVVKDVKPAPIMTKTVKLRPPGAAPVSATTPPRPATNSTDSIKKSEVIKAAEDATTPVTPTPTKTVKLKSPIKPGNMTATKSKVLEQDKTVKMKPVAMQDETVKMKAVPDAATGAQKTSKTVTPPMPFEMEAEEPGILMTLLNLASVAAVSAGLYYTFQSVTMLKDL